MELLNFLHGIDILFGNKFILLIFTIIFGYLAFKSYQEKNKNLKVFKFDGKIIDHNCVSQLQSSRSFESRDYDDTRDRTTTYNNKMKCTVKLTYNKKDLEDDPDESDEGIDEIILTNLTGGPYVKGQTLKLQSVEGKKENIKVCCDSPKINFYIFSSLTVICLLFLFFYNKSDE